MNLHLISKFSSLIGYGQNTQTQDVNRGNPILRKPKSVREDSCRDGLAQQHSGLPALQSNRGDPPEESLRMAMQHLPQAVFGKGGTIFADSPLPLDKWLTAMWLISNSKNGISSYAIHRGVGVTQKTAWFMLQRIRLAMQTKSFRKLQGEVEVDETYIGGLARNMHAHRREQKIKGTGGDGKVAVMGLLERHGEVKTKVIPDTQTRTLQNQVHKHVKPGAELFTDQHAGYKGLDMDYVHQVINHAEKYVEGRVHTNGMENFWSLLKRCIKGTYIAVEPWHLHRYLDEEAFRFNTRKQTDGERFAHALSQISGRKLTYKQVIGQAA